MEGTITLSEKLGKAFKELRKDKLVARQNFWCCQSCATAAIDEKEEVSKGKVGYVFYHNQDNTSKNEGKDFYLAFGSLVVDDNKRDEESLKVGVKVMQILERNGVQTNWDGNISTRIKVLGQA